MHSLVFDSLGNDRNPSLDIPLEGHLCHSLIILLRNLSENWVFQQTVTLSERRVSCDTDVVLLAELDHLLLLVIRMALDLNKAQLLSIP